MAYESICGNRVFYKIFLSYNFHLASQSWGLRYMHLQALLLSPH